MHRGYNLFAFFIISISLISFIAGETGCPPAKYIEPCTCIKYPAPRLTCNRILNSDDLMKVFDASERYTFQEVHINDSAFLYIPVEIFSKSYVKELYLNNSSFLRVLDDDSVFKNSQIDYKHPSKIQIENSKVLRGIFSTNFTSLSNLTELIIKHTPIRVLSLVTVSYTLPSGLKQLSFSANNLNNIRPGAFRLLTNLDKFSLQRNRVKNLTRDIFPKPFNVRILNFDFNRIESIPNDMFHDMPNLQFLSMQDNLITTIPESAFYGRSMNVAYFKFDGNPLQCDCKILWIIKDKPEILGGGCVYPEKFIGRQLKDLSPSEFAC